MSFPKTKLLVAGASCRDEDLSQYTLEERP